MTQQVNEITESLINDDARELAAYFFDELPLHEQAANVVRGGRDLTATPPPPQPCFGCSWGPPVLNHNETTVSDEEASTLLNDLPIAQAELDMVKGGDASPLPVLLVIADQQDFYVRR